MSRIAPRVTAGRVYVLRPYSQRIRARVETALASVGLSIVDDVPAGTPDERVLEWLRTRTAPDALLVPFHAHRDQRGELVHGFELVRRFRRELPFYESIPVISPVSDLGLAAAGLLAARDDQRALIENLLLLRESELDGDLSFILRNFLRSSKSGAGLLSS